MCALPEENYLVWLCAKVTIPEEHGQSYWSLFEIMHNYEFVWLVTGDDNRAADARDLRHEYLYSIGEAIDDNEYQYEASVLEVLIAFSRKAEFQTDIPAREWFWKFLRNLNLDSCYDAGGVDSEYIQDTLYNFVWRLYDSDGDGGLFPIFDPHEDQTKVEIWYQFCEYLEHGK